MKKRLLAPAAALSLLAASCASSGAAPGPEARALRVAQWSHSASVPLDPDLGEGGPLLSIEVSLAWAVGPGDQAGLVNGIVYMAPSREDYVEAVAARARGEWRRMALEGGAEAAMAGEWSHRETVAVAGLGFGGGLVLRRDVEASSGGEAVRRRRYYVFDLDALRRLRLGDLFGDFQGDKARGMVYAALRRRSGLGEGGRLSLAGFFSDSPELSFNFSISPEGLGLRWNPGEIAPGAMGAIDIALPWADLEPALLEGRMEMLRAMFGAEGGAR